MQVRSHRDVYEFLQCNQDMLEEQEAANNLILGIANSLTKESPSNNDAAPILLSVMLEEVPVSAALCTPPFNLILYCREQIRDLALKQLTDFLSQKKYILPGVIGSKPTAERFAEIWSAMHNLKVKLEVDQMVYKLSAVEPLIYAEGELVQATPNEHGLIVDWVKQFSRDIHQSVFSDRAEIITRNLIESGKVYLWKDKDFVSMAGCSRATTHGITITYVFTPPAFRKRGYASSCVAQLSKKMLDKYDFCTLYTDLANPTSNQIYKRIGYQPIDHSHQIAFF